MSISILGTAGSYYLGIDWGGGDCWRHDASGAGDFDLRDDAGGTFLDIVYDRYAVRGNVTTFAEKTLSTGFSVVTKLTQATPGVYRIAHTFHSQTARWLRLDKRLQGRTVTATSNVARYADDAVATSDLTAFHASAAHHAGGAAVGLIAGNGFDNFYTIIHWAYSAHTDWYNAAITAKTARGISLTYGWLANGAAHDYTVRVPAGEPTTLSYVICVCAPSSPATLNAALYSAYHDAFCPTPGRDDRQKMFWATAHQLQRLKRHIKAEGARVLVLSPANYGYSGMISAGDMIFGAMGIGPDSPGVMRQILQTLHAVGAPGAPAIVSSVLGGPDTVMDGSCAVYLPFLELFARTYCRYTPDDTARRMYRQTADSYADAINNLKLVPDAATRLAHFYADLFCGVESIGYGDFELDFAFDQSGDPRPRYRWAEEISGRGSTARIGTDAGTHAPHSGRCQCRLVADGAVYVRRRLMRIAVPAGKTLTATAYVNIPEAFRTGGFRFHIEEYNAAGRAVATSASPDVTSTAQWQQQAFAWTLTGETSYIAIAIEAHGSGTAYVDDVQCTIDPARMPKPWRGLFWNANIMPPQLLTNALCPEVFAMTWAQVNLKSLKALLGDAWTSDHQAALDAIDASYPAAYWTDASERLVRDDLYHAVRKNWLSSFTLFSHWMWHLLSGEKIFTERQVASLYAAFPRDAAGGPYGDLAYKGWVCNLDGSSVGDEADFMQGWPRTAGWYINGGHWLWSADMFFHRAAIWAGVPGARENLSNRLRLEVHRVYASHETIDATGKATAVEGYAANAALNLE